MRNQTKPIGYQKKPIGYQMVSIANQTKPTETNCQQSKSKSRERRVRVRERIRVKSKSRVRGSNRRKEKSIYVSRASAVPNGRPMSSDYMTGLRRARIEKGLTLRAVSKATFFSYGSLARAERGTLYVGNKADVRRDEFWRTMSDFYGKSIDELKEVYT